MHIFSRECTVGMMFNGPERVTFLYKVGWNAPMLCRESGVEPTHMYMVVYSRVTVEDGWELHASTVADDGHTMYHLLRRKLT